MKQKRFVSILLSCLLLASNGTVMNALAVEDQADSEVTTQIEDTTKAVTDTIEDMTVETETEPETTIEFTQIVTEAMTTESVQAAAEPQSVLTNEPESAGAAHTIANVTLKLAQSADTKKSGLIYAEDGTASYLNNGKKMTGHFSVTSEYIVGDLVDDGVVNAADAAKILIAAAEAGASDTTAAELIAQSSDNVTTDYQAEQIADVNNDGSINAADAAALLVYAAEIGAGEEVKPLGCGQYYADENGVLQQGWITSENTTLYAGSNYILKEGWTKIGDNIYYFSDAAEMQTGYLGLDEKTYYMKSDGTLTTGWLDTSGDMFYFDIETGAQAFGMTTIDSSTYYFDETGALVSDGWVTTEEGIYYADEKGTLLTSWQELGGNHYYFYKDGKMAVGTVAVEDKTYLFDNEGVQQFGWREYENGKRYFQEDTGAMAVGFLEMADGTRFFNSIGLMATGWTSYQTDKYYFHEDGIMQTGMMELDGQKYRFEENGVYHPIKICLDAGHYAKYNRSPVVSTYWESDFTWKIHLYLKDALEVYGIEVITTREDKDTDLGLKTRGRISEGCDLFLSLHSNACNNSSIDAPLACCQVNGSADELGQMLADLVAEVMETNQKGTIWKRPGTVETDKDWYSVLYGAAEVGTPGILLEHSYHTNLRSTNWLLDDANVERMAKAEAELLARYFGMID